MMMTTTAPAVTAPITRLTSAETEHAIAVMVLAFSADPANRWVWPEPAQYLAALPSFVRALAGKAFEQGTAYAIGDFAGAALWLPPGVHSDEAAVIEVFERTTSPGVQGDLFAIFEQLAGFHPGGPHWYLPMIGVDPAQQRRGCGGELLRHTLAACDRDGLPAFLESTNPANVSLYERHGFEVLGTVRAGSSPPIFPMLRRPR